MSIAIGRNVVFTALFGPITWYPACRFNGNRSSLSVSKGDEVIYGRYAGSDIEVEGKEIKILREGDILAKVVK